MFHVSDVSYPSVASVPTFFILELSAFSPYNKYMFSASLLLIDSMLLASLHMHGNVCINMSVAH